MNNAIGPDSALPINRLFFFAFLLPRWRLAPLSAKRCFKQERRSEKKREKKRGESLGYRVRRVGQPVRAEVHFYSDSPSSLFWRFALFLQHLFLYFYPLQ